MAPRLHLGALGDLLLGHLPGDLQGRAVDAGHEAVAEGSAFGAVVEGLHHDGLLKMIENGSKSVEICQK